MTTLATATTSDFNRFYDWKNYKINYNEINNGYDEMRREGYSEQLIASISGILNEQES